MADIEQWKEEVEKCNWSQNQAWQQTAWTDKISIIILFLMTLMMQEDNPRSKATILEVIQESETIKRLVLQVEDARVSFKAGQWVDFFIPGVTVFTGYSMCSPPHQLSQSHSLELAIKNSPYPPTQWVHSKCKAGDTVEIKVGTSKFFHQISPNTPPSHLLLLAAGIGINPVYSIFQHFVHEQREGPETHGQAAGFQQGTGRLCLLYSARTSQELVFKNQILEMSETCPNIAVQLFSTGQSVKPEGEDRITNGRITSAAIRSHTSGFDKARTEVYVCGPPGFIDDMEAHCIGQGLGLNQIHYEKWW